MSRSIRFVLGDQLSFNLASLVDADAEHDVVLMAEVAEEATYVRHHKKKIAFLFSAMRHFAAELRKAGFTVDYRMLDGPDAGGTFTEVLRSAVATHKPDRVILTEPGEWRVGKMMRQWQGMFDCAVEIREDRRFLCSHRMFREWAAAHGDHLRMEYFYREMRKRGGWLMRDKQPVGRRWNLDAENRKPIPAEVEPPSRPSYEPDATTRAVLDLVDERFADHFGTLEGFDYPVTRKDALASLDWFAEQALPHFGSYQDAMRQGEPVLFHSHLSALINCGLLEPAECCRRAEHAYYAGAAPLNAVEGYIRQIIGWREFVRGVYWLSMPDYGASNCFNAQRPLPDFFWNGRTDMNCLAQAIGETRQNAYAHHIQRLMVIGNFCLLAGLDPKQVQEWYLLVYHDAYEWVEMPNVVGMILYADGGGMASKPYAASGAYINKMSDYCGSCRYDVKARSGLKACPFNYLYWDFLARNRARLEENPRMKVIYRSLDAMEDGRKKAIAGDAAAFLERLG